MNQRIARNVVFSTLLTFGGCTSIPSFVINKDSSFIKGSDQSVSEAAPAGPKIASLVANLKCELWNAANSTTTLPFYEDDPSLTTKNHTVKSPEQIYNLRNIFSEIEYIAEATFTLDVVDTSSFNPTAVLTRPLQAVSGLLPATSEVLSVGGSLSEAPHRYIQFNEAIDFSRLVGPMPGFPESSKLARAPALCAESQKNPKGGELQGDLGLKETLASGMIAATMSDISVHPVGADTSTPTIQGARESIEVSSNNTFGLISAQIDFTIVANINGGPTWALRYFKGPGGSNQGLINLNRQTKDTLLITFVPVCIRRPAPPTDSTTTASITGRIDYDKISPPMVDGTPGWANYLPSCNAAGQNSGSAAATAGKQVNNILQLLPH